MALEFYKGICLGDQDWQMITGNSALWYMVFYPGLTHMADAGGISLYKTTSTCYKGCENITLSIFNFLGNNIFDISLSNK